MAENDITPVLRTMISQIEERGWTKGTLMAESGEVCLEGACNLGLQDLIGRWWLCEDWYEKWKVPVGQAIAPAIQELFPGRKCNQSPRHWGVIVSFNDDPETTKEDVLLVLKHAIGVE